MSDAERESLFDRLDHARRTLELPDRVSLAQIRQRYRELSRRWHPDLCPDDPELCKQKQAELNAAYGTLTDFCNNFQYSLRREDVEQYAGGEDFWWRHFGGL
ncbi:J domain-containing protein [bacterium]|nr:J domain-containing protein [bacterium]